MEIENIKLITGKAPTKFKTGLRPGEPVAMFIWKNPENKDEYSSAAFLSDPEKYTTADTERIYNENLKQFKKDINRILKEISHENIKKRNNKNT